MRILVVSRDDYQRVFGGDTIMIEGINQHLIQEEVEITRINAHTLPIKPDFDLVYLTFLHQIDPLINTIQWADQHKIPVLISPFFESNLLMYAEFALRDKGKWSLLSKILGDPFTRKIYILWHTNKIQRSKEWLNQREILNSSHILTNSKYETNQLKQWFKIENLQSYIVPLGINPEYFHPSEDSSIEELGDLNDFILEVARIEARKNQLVLLKSLLHTEHPLVFLGKPIPYEEKYHYRVKKLAQQRGNVHFIGFLPFNQMAELYSRAAVHVLPSWSERPGLVTLEAVACGCKAVTTIHCPIQEYLGNDVFYCYPENIDNIRVSIQEALGSDFLPGLDKKVRERFTWEETTKGFLNVVERIIV